MMASLVINSIRSALNVLERSDPGSYNYFIKYKLKNLETFVLCAGKLGNDAQRRFDKDSTLGSLLQRIHDAVSRNTQQIQPDVYDFDFESLLQRIHDAASRNTQQIQPDIYDFGFEHDIYDFDHEIGLWYSTLSDALPQPTLDEVTAIIASVLETQQYFLPHSPPSSVETIEAMVEKVTFFRNFIRFATVSSVVEPRQLENLLLHIQAVTVKAAYIFHMVIIGYVEPNASVQELKIIDHGACETYTQALISFKLSTQLHSPTPELDHDPLVTMKDFIDALLSKLWERLQMDTRIAISTSFKLQLLYDGLKLLTSMLKDQQNKFHEEIREHTRVVICDAGVLIFSLYQKDVEEVVVSIPDVLQRIDRISQQVEGKDLSISDLLRKREVVGGNDLPRTNELGFIRFLVENLMGMTSSKACYSFQSQFQMIHGELSSLRDSLEEIVEERNEQKELETLWNAGVKVAYGIEFLIDQLVLGDFQGSSSTSFDSTIEEILKDIKSINSEIHHHASDIKVKKVSKTSDLPASRSSFPIADEIVGLDDDTKSIIDRLTRGSKQLKIVAIVGMPGIGKTTLAIKVFNHPSVTFHFHICAWCCVSQLFDRKKVLRELLNHIDPNENSKLAEQELSEKLWRGLKGKTYLIFLDDVWDIEVWNCLRASFPDDSCGSRIILTSRHRVVALLDEEPHFVSQLTEDESWELLQKKLSPRNDCTLEFYDIGKQIAANCKGLPLTVVVVAGLLANLEAEGWKKVLENMSSISETDHCMNVLELSYKHLPDHLKPCFLYFGSFPEDIELPVKWLIWLWIAEGFVRKTESKSLEDVARDYMMDLAGKSLVIVSQKRSRGGVKACRIHDLLHDFCRIKAKEENFFKLLEGGHDEFLCFSEPGYMRRLCVLSERKHFKKLRLFCPRMHSLLFFAHDEERQREHDISFIIPRYNRIRVLEISQYSVGGGIPSEIGLFLQLKYLSVSGDIFDIPSSIGSLTNLETLILNSHGDLMMLPVPDTFWNLQKLRHLDVVPAFSLPVENLENFPDLRELQSCSTAIIGPGDSIGRLIRKFPNIRKLRCHLKWDDYNQIFIPDSVYQLESLHLRLWHGRLSEYGVPGYSFRFDFLKNLKKLTLSGFFLHGSDISRIGKLPNLEVLKFDFVDFHENTWDIVEGEFLKLRFFRLTDSNIVRWTASDDQFRCLQRLVVRSCTDLEEIPCCFENVDVLEIIEVFNCPYSVNSVFERIQEEQMETGNSLPKIHISY